MTSVVHMALNTNAANRTVGLMTSDVMETLCAWVSNSSQVKTRENKASYRKVWRQVCGSQATNTCVLIILKINHCCRLADDQFEKILKDCFQFQNKTHWKDVLNWGTWVLWFDHLLNWVHRVALFLYIPNFYCFYRLYYKFKQILSKLHCN